MLNLHTVVQSFSRYAQANSEQQRNEVLTKIRDIIKLAGIPDEKLDQKQTEIYQVKRAEVISLMHISVNVTGDRTIQLVKDGELPMSKARDIYSKLHRTNAEQCFGIVEPEVSIYGGLNLNSQHGAAPNFSPDIWLKLVRSEIQNRTTFTARDSYNITLPFLAEFELNRGREALRSEIYTWETVPDYVLNRFWDVQDIKTTAYIEAQIWGGVLLNHVETFHIKRTFVDLFLEALEEKSPADRLQLVRDRIVLFD